MRSTSPDAAQMTTACPVYDHRDSPTSWCSGHVEMIAAPWRNRVVGMSEAAPLSMVLAGVDP